MDPAASSLREIACNRIIHNLCVGIIAAIYAASVAAGSAAFRLEGGVIGNIVIHQHRPNRVADEYAAPKLAMTVLNPEPRNSRRVILSRKNLNTAICIITVNDCLGNTV